MKKLALAIALTVTAPTFAVLPASPSHVEYSATRPPGVVAFSFTFKVLSTSQVGVYLDGIPQIAGYTVTLTSLGASGGTVTFTTAPDGKVVKIVRTIAYGQDCTFSPLSALRSSTLETCFDKLGMQTQRLSKTVDDLSTGVLAAGDASAAVVGVTGTTTARALKDRFAFNVADFGATGDGATDDTIAIRAALVAGAGKTVVFPKPSARYRITGELIVSANTLVEGEGQGLVELQVPAGSGFVVFDVNGVSNVSIRGFKFTKAAGADLTAGAYAVAVRGAATDVLVENIESDGFDRGVNISGSDGTVPGTAKRITVRKAYAHNSPTTFGFNVDEADVVLLEDCHGWYNWLDGFKIRRKTLNVTIRGGSTKYNGQVRAQTGSGAGDGLDGFAGGNTLVLDGLVAEYNYGNGIIVKTDGLTRDDAATYGYIRNIQITNVVCRYSMVATTYGLGVYAFDDGGGLPPLPANVTISGGIYEENQGYGLYIDARDVTVHGGVALRNLNRDVSIGPNALNVELHGVIAKGAGFPGGAGGGTNLFIRGKHIRVFGGSFMGVDADNVKTDADLNLLTVYATQNVYITNEADDVVMWDPVLRYSTSANDLTIQAGGPNNIVIHRRGTGNPPGMSGKQGGIGSTWTRTDAGLDEEVLWVKTSGTPDSAATGWSRARPRRLTGVTVNNVQTTIAHGLGYAPRSVQITPKGNSVIWESAPADATNIYLTGSAGTTADIHVN